MNDRYHVAHKPPGKDPGHLAAMGKRVIDTQDYPIDVIHDYAEWLGHIAKPGTIIVAYRERDSKLFVATIKDIVGEPTIVWG